MNTRCTGACFSRGCNCLGHRRSVPHVDKSSAMASYTAVQGMKPGKPHIRLHVGVGEWPTVWWVTSAGRSITGLWPAPGDALHFARLHMLSANFLPNFTR